MKAQGGGAAGGGDGSNRIAGPEGSPPEALLDLTGDRLGLEDQLQRIQGLYQLTSAIGRAEDLDTIYAVALDTLHRVLGAERASILLFDEDGVMRFKAWRGISDGYRRAVEGHSPWRRDEREAQPIVCGDTAGDATLSDLRPVLVGERILAAAFIPLIDQGRLLGKFMLYYDRPYTPSPEEIRLAQVIAGHVAFAIERKRASDECVRLLECEKAARQDAESASRLKDEFLATVSHELRTPLTSILGWSRLLRAGMLDGPTSEQAIETIERNARLQARLIEDLLDVSRIITGTLRLEVRPVDVLPVIEAAVEVVRPAAAAKDILLDLRLEPTGGLISGDPARLQQIAWNLLSNAIKYTPRGGRVEVWLRRVAGALELRVRDTGIGIAPGFLPFVFERFRQADGSTKRTTQGLGLGLAIVRHLVELHGGTVAAESAGEGTGASFTVLLPLLARQELAAGARESSHPVAPAQAERAFPSLDGVSVLVVDDESDSLRLVAQALGQCGAAVTAAASATEALRAFDAARPDVVVSDIAMPGKDGYDMLREIRARETRGRRTPAVALTGFARAEDRMRALRAGFQRHVPKPVDPAELAAVVADLARGGRKTFLPV